jgi:PHB/PHA accumulation regulator DNA-binding domain
MSGPRLLQWLHTRRLWDVQAHQYVSFDGVRDWRGAGNEVRVTEQETNLDVTRELLLKVVLHDQQGGARFRQRCVVRLDPHTGHGAPPAGTSVPGSAGEEAAAHPCNAERTPHRVRPRTR